MNVAEALVAAGLAEVMRHGSSDDRSSHDDALLAAEALAKGEKKAMHSTKEAPTRRVADLSTDAGRAKSFLGSLQVHIRATDVHGRRTVIDIALTLTPACPHTCTFMHALERSLTTAAQRPLRCSWTILD